MLQPYWIVTKVLRNQDYKVEAITYVVAFFTALFICKKLAYGLNLSNDGIERLVKFRWLPELSNRSRECQIGRYECKIEPRECQIEASECQIEATEGQIEATEGQIESREG